MSPKSKGTDNKALKKNSNDSRNSTSGYMSTGNASKYAAENGTRNKN